MDYEIRPEGRADDAYLRGVEGPNNKTRTLRRHEALELDVPQPAHLHEFAWPKVNMAIDHSEHVWPQRRVTHHHLYRQPVGLIETEI